MAWIFLASGRWAACSWGACRTVCRNVSIADAAFPATVLSVGLWLLCVCLRLLTTLLASLLGKGGDGCQQERCQQSK